ncbi:hypothetical protein DAI22_01g147500 [Oryza sativa Japonica Group]|nr:hypothetical protein DAI22_01g147500 [Oryza sativa Japonica Group]
MERVASSCLSLLAQRRGYSVAAAVAKRTMAKAAEEKTAWVPDPVTGYYRPAGGAKEVDAAELRAKLLSNSKRMAAN